MNKELIRLWGELNALTTHVVEDNKKSTDFYPLTVRHMQVVSICAIIRAIEGQHTHTQLTTNSEG